MSYSETKHLSHILGFILLLLNISNAKEEFVHIPVSISPIVQLPLTELSQTARFIYGMDRDFYSKVTVTDVARNEEKDLIDTIKKPIGVLFFISASSRVSGTLTRKKLARSEGSSKWSYKIPVKQILSESNGSVTKLDDKIQVYKIQELAMKVLARKYKFSVNTILQRHHMNIMEFYAADEKQWIKIVGTITNIVIENISNELNLTPCYVAELINKTQKEMEGFTLQEVDIYLTNISKLKEELPAYNSATLRSFYETFNITPTHIAEVSSINTSALKLLGLKDTIQLFTRTIMFKLGLREIMLPPSISGAENETICRSQWNMFKVVVATETFERQAREMSITTTTLGALIGIPYTKVKRLSPIKIVHLVEIVISPLKEGKRKIEEFTFGTLKTISSSKRLNTKKHNAISLIKRTTKLSKRKLNLLYNWTPHDYHFARLFSVQDLGDECSFDVNEKTLLSLAKINIGEANADTHCKAFFALRLVWGQASLNDLKTLHHLNTKISLDEPIAVIVGKLTNSSTKITYRVLSKTPIIQWLLQKISLNNVSEMTNHTDTYLEEIPVQRIVLMIHELYIAGSFDSLIQVIAKTIYYSTNASTESYAEELILTDVRNNGYGQPTAHPRSLSIHHLPDTALLVSFFIALLFMTTSFG